MTNFTMLVRDRPNLTQQALESLSENTRDITVTILDDRSHDATAGMLDFFERTERPDFFVFHNKAERGTGPLRNSVIKLSEGAWGRGDYLVLSDNDTCFTPKWLEILIECYEESWKCGFKIIGALNHPFHQPIPNRQRVKVGSHEVYPVHALALQSMIMKWEVFDEFGPFCDTPVNRVCQSEDVDMTNKIIATGGQIGVVSPALVVSTGITNTFGEKIPGWELVKAQCPAGVIIE